MRFTNLQALRTIGATIVVVCHARYYAMTELGLTSSVLDWIFGYLAGPALMVFFAISGYVLVHSFESGSTHQFVRNRLLRIFPTFWVATAISLLLLKLQRMPVVLDFKLIPSLLLIPVGEGNAMYPIGIEWTLVFEFLFYMWLGLMLFASRRYGPTIGAVCWLAVIIGAAAVRDPGPLLSLPKWNEIAFSPFAAPFLLGTLAVRLRPYGRMVCLVAPVVGPGLILLSRLIPRWDIATLVSGLGGAAIIAWAASARQVSAENPLVIFGDWSYGVYLLHMPILAMVFRMSVRKHWAHPSFDLVAFGIVLAIGLGLLFGRCEMAVYRRLRRMLISRPPAEEPRVIPISKARPAQAA